MSGRNTYITLLLVGTFLGCTDDFDELPTEFDTIGEIIGFTVADTVEAGDDVRVQISFPRICGGEFSGIERFDNGMTIKLTPGIHVVAQRQCPNEVTFLTVQTTVQFPSAGEYTLVGHGRFRDIKKKVVVLSTYNAPLTYRFRYKFLRVNGLPSAYQTADFTFPDRLPPETTPIQADSNGIWETTLTDTIPRLRYQLAGLDFEAVRGMKEDGIILVP